MKGTKIQKSVALKKSSNTISRVYGNKCPKRSNKHHGINYPENSFASLFVGKMQESTDWGALVDTFKGDDRGENEDKRQQKSKNQNCMEQSAVRDVASSDLDLHQISDSSIDISSAAARWYRYTSHARWEVQLHLPPLPLSSSSFPLPLSYASTNNLFHHRCRHHHYS